VTKESVIVCKAGIFLTNKVDPVVNYKRCNGEMMFVFTD
jgi:hypothetical protein